MKRADRSSDPIRDENLVLRDATETDCRQIADIYNESIRLRDATMDLLTKDADDFIEILRGFSERETILVLEKEEKMIGWGIIKQYSDRLGYRVACETSVYLKREKTGLGYGTFIKKAIIERCRKYKYHHLVAKIHAQNASSIRYNENLGYEIVGTQKEIGYFSGRWVDIVIMQLILEDVPPFLPEI